MLQRVLEHFFDRYGLASLVGLAIAGSLVWLLAHLSARPGTEVSVLWGMVRYTRGAWDADPISRPTSEPGWEGVWEYRMQMSRQGSELQVGLAQISVTPTRQVVAVFTNCRDGGGYFTGRLSDTGPRLDGVWENWAGQSGELSLELSPGRMSFRGNYQIDGIRDSYQWSGDRVRADDQHRRLTKRCT